MKIGYDGKRAVRNNTGLGNYSRLLVDVMAERYPENEYVLYSPGATENPRLDRVMRHSNVSLTTPDTLIGRSAGSIWRVTGITSQLSRDGIDLFHGLSGELPLNIGKLRRPTVVTVHDLIFRHHPECYKPIDRAIYDYKFRQAAHNATRIIAISECTRRDLIEFYDAEPEKIDVVYQGCAHQFHRRPTPEEIAAVRKKYGIDRPYIISVGTIEQRKNQIMPVRGIRGLPDELDLILVGRRTAYARILDNYIQTYSMNKRVKFIENAAFADLPALYAGAFCSTYTSRFEGFGIPVIESLSVGTPVIIASGSCLEEAAGPAAPVVDPDDIEGWVNAVKDMIDYPDARTLAIREGQRHAARFTDEAMADGTMTSYNKAIGF